MKLSSFSVSVVTLVLDGVDLLCVAAAGGRARLVESVDAGFLVANHLIRDSDFLVCGCAAASVQEGLMLTSLMGLLALVRRRK